MKDEGGKTVSYGEYFSTGHFIEATFENWESEFLQMALLVTLTMFFYQKGSSQSKDPDKKKPARKPRRTIKSGSIRFEVYKHSLSYILFSLFLVSFLLHWYGSMRQYNHDQTLKGKPTESAIEYLGNSKLWFESFENWQSEFLSVVSIVVLSIYFRQENSPQSKPVKSPDSKTGD